MFAARKDTVPFVTGLPRTRTVPLTVASSVEPETGGASEKRQPPAPATDRARAPPPRAPARAGASHPAARRRVMVPPANRLGAVAAGRASGPTNPPRRDGPR